MNTIGYQIARWRRIRFLSQPKLAKKAGIPKSTLWEIENNSRANPTISTLYKIAKALGVDITAIVR